MTLKLTRRLFNPLLLRRFASKDSSLTTTDSNKELTTKKPSEIARPKRAFTLINPKTSHQLKRIDDVPIQNEIDFIRHRLTEKSKFLWLTMKLLVQSVYYEIILHTT